MPQQAVAQMKGSDVAKAHWDNQYKAASLKL